MTTVANGPQCDPFAPFSGRPHEHMTEAQMEAHRRRPVDPGFVAMTTALRVWSERRASEPPRVTRAHPEDIRSAAPDMAKAITRQARKTRVRRKGN